MRAESGSWIEGIVDRYERPLVLYAQRLLADVERARDVVQETFLRLCRQERASIDGHVAEWLYTVCRNPAFDILRKEQRMIPLGTTENPHHITSDPPPGESDDNLSRTLSLLATLPANQQEVIRLKFQHGLSYQEISRVTSLSVSNVGFLLHVGLKTLRGKLAPTHARPTNFRSTP